MDVFETVCKEDEKQYNVILLGFTMINHWVNLLW